MSHTLKRKIGDPKPEAVLRKQMIEALTGLLAIAELAMPDTYYTTDTRVKRAKVLLEQLKWNL